MKAFCQLGDLHGWPETCGKPAVATYFDDRADRDFDVCAGHADGLHGSDLTRFDEGDDLIAEDRAEAARAWSES